jgi:Arabinose efflux permease
MKNNIKACIYSISVVSALNTLGLTVIISELVLSYPQQKVEEIQLLQTIPSIIIILASLSVGMILSKLRKKTVILLSFSSIAIIGLACFFIRGYYFILFARILSGFAFGVENPIKIAIITNHFQGVEKAKIMGFQSAMTALSAFICSIVVGYLTKFGYQYYFLVYLIAIVAFLVFYKLYPEEDETITHNKTSFRLNRITLIAALLSALYSLCMVTYNTNLSLHISHYLKGDTVLTGLIASMHPLWAILMGVLFGKIFNRIHYYLSPLSMVAGTMGMLLVSLFPSNQLCVFLFASLCGLSLGGNSQTMAMIMTNHCKDDEVTSSIAISTLFTGIATLLSPVIFNTTVKNVFGNLDTRYIFSMAFAIALITVLLTLFFVRKINIKQP